MLALPVNPTFLLDTHGHKTHVVIPFEEWELLARDAVEPDDQDLAIIARLERERAENPEDFEEAQVSNPIRMARLAAHIRQEDVVSCQTYGSVGGTRGLPAAPLAFSLWSPLTADHG